MGFLFFFLLCFVDGSLDCTKCRNPVFWGPVHACVFPGAVSVTNAFCPTGETLLQCLAASQNMGVQWAGTCGCPADCAIGGSCVKGVCVCNSGFTGPSCSLCSNCSCNHDTQCLDDCSGKVLPPVVWPKLVHDGVWVQEHALFNMSRVTTVYLGVEHLDWLLVKGEKKNMLWK